MWTRALAAGLLAGVGIGVSGTLALESRKAQPLPQTQSYDTAGELVYAIRETGVACTLLDTGDLNPAACQLPDGGPILSVQSVPDGSLTGRMPLRPALVGPNWIITADESDAGYVLARVQRGVGGELRTVPGLPAGPAAVDYGR